MSNLIDEARIVLKLGIIRSMNDSTLHLDRTVEEIIKDLIDMCNSHEVHRWQNFDLAQERRKKIEVLAVENRDLHKMVQGRYGWELGQLEKLLHSVQASNKKLRAQVAEMTSDLKHTNYQLDCYKLQARDE